MIKAVLFDWGNVLRSKHSWRRAKELYLLAEKLRSIGIKTGVLSNNYLVAAKLLRVIGEYKGFEPVIISAEVRLRKPDPAIYQLAINQLGLHASEIIFIDNLTANIETANKLGMHAVLANSASEVVAGVKDIVRRENKLEL